MDDPGEVRGLDAPTRLRDQVGGALNRQPALALEQVGEAFADEVLHDDEGRAVVGDAEVDGGRHVVVLQRPRRLGLALEPVQDVAPLGEVAAQELDREAPPDDGVMRLVHDAHPAPREQANDAVLPADDLTDTSRVGGGLHRAFSVSPRIVSRSTCPSIRRYARWRLIPSIAAARATLPPAVRSAPISAGSSTGSPRAADVAGGRRPRRPRASRRARPRRSVPPPHRCAPAGAPRVSVDSFPCSVNSRLTSSTSSRTLNGQSYRHSRSATSLSKAGARP